MHVQDAGTLQLRDADRQQKKEEGKLLILEVLELPTLSSVVNRLLKVSPKNRSDGFDMAEIISEDRELTDKILKIANSTYFGLSQKVPSVARAIKVLGFEAVRSIALSASVIQAFGESSDQGHFDRSRFWAHSLACAYLSKKIAGMTHRAARETGFVCGLLHDVGKIVLDIHFPDSYRRALDRLENGETTSVAAEDEILGFTHAEVGMWLAQRWRFPKAVVFTIANHHGMLADDPRYRCLTAMVRLANHICLKEGVCLENQAPEDPLDGGVIKELKLDEFDLAELQQNLATRKEPFMSFFANWQWRLQEK